MNEETPASIHSICRTCLNSLQQCEAFDLFMVPGLAKKLCVCTSLSVEHLDGFPRNLCTACYSRLNDLHAFQRQCVESVEKFKELVSKNCFSVQSISDEGPSVMNVAGLDDGELDDFDPLLNSKVEIDNEEDVFKMIEDVDRESDNVDNLEEAFNDDGDSDFNNDDADFQAEASDSDDEMPLSRLQTKTTTAKTKKAKGKEKEKDEDEPNQKPKRKRIPAAERDRHRILDCDICHQKFKKAIRYEEHMKRHNDQLPFKCTVNKCLRGFTTSTGLKHHMEHAHTELCKQHPCTVEGCEESFAQTRLLTKHMRKVHNIAKPDIHPCSECEKTFRCPMALKKHMYKHTGEELPFGCTICQKRFRVNTELRDHLLRHAGIRNFVCPYCGVGRTTKQELEKHIASHTKEKKFLCDQCDHSTHNKQCMTKHIRVVHMKIRDHQCQYCQKMFSSKYHLQNHEKLHTRDECFECNLCGRKFLFESRLRSHLRTHAKNGTLPPPQTNAEQEQKKLIEPVKVPEIPAKSRDPRRVEIVDISQLAGTSVNPIPSVSVSSWSPQQNFTKKEGKLTCPECGRGFNHASNMRLHIRTVHEQIKDFVCRFCPKRFSRSQYLREHEYTHTGEKPYECPICKKCFAADGSLRSHMNCHDKPPKVPKPATIKLKDPQEARLKLNTEPTTNYQQFQDPEAERDAATAELVANQLTRYETPRWGLAKGEEVTAAAFKQLETLQIKKYDKVSYDGLKSDVSQDFLDNHV